MAINVPGLVVMVFFYLMVLGTGIWASMKSKKVKGHNQADQMEVTLLGNRGISLAVGVFTTTGECCRVVVVLDLKSQREDKKIFKLSISLCFFHFTIIICC